MTVPMPSERPVEMIIHISGMKGNPIHISPDPATVHVGDLVTWKLKYEVDNPYSGPIALTIYFDHGSPFRWKSRTTKTETEAPGKPEEGHLEGDEPQTEGEYKYGVRLSNALTNEMLSDDDPRLIVLARTK